MKLWDNGFVYKDFPLIHYRISHGDSFTYIAYIYRGKVFSHRFSYTDPTRYIPTEEVKKILKKLRLMTECGETHKINIVNKHPTIIFCLKLNPIILTL